MASYVRLILVLAMFIHAAPGSSGSFLGDPYVTTRYSELLAAKQAVYDSLLPALDGDRAMQELLRVHPQLWSLQRIEEEGDLATALQVEVVYIDGVREEQYCKVLAGSGPGQWKLEMGVDFTSAGSNTVAAHVAQCLQQARDQMGYLIKKDARVVQVPPRKIWEEIGESRISHEIDPELQVRLLDTHREVVKSGECPTDIHAYARLLDVWNEVKAIPIDLDLMDADLNPNRNGGRQVRSCAFSREWNKRYSEEAVMECRADEETCVYRQTETGTSHWLLEPETSKLVYQRRSFLGIGFGAKSVRNGGTMLDLRMVPLSGNLYLEAYLDKDGSPVSLGYVVVGKQQEE